MLGRFSCSDVTVDGHNFRVGGVSHGKTSEIAVGINRGFVCVKCRERLQVSRTVNPCTGRVIRYRKCPKCGLNVVTEERARVGKYSISSASS